MAAIPPLPLASGGPAHGGELLHFSRDESADLIHCGTNVAPFAPRKGTSESSHEHRVWRVSVRHGLKDASQWAEGLTPEDAIAGRPDVDGPASGIASADRIQYVALDHLRELRPYPSEWRGSRCAQPDAHWSDRDLWPPCRGRLRRWIAHRGSRRSKRHQIATPPLV